MNFRWNAWNIEHVAEHGVSPKQVEWVVRTVRWPYPEGRVNGEYCIRGADRGGLLLQVIYVLDPDGTIYVIHARPLTDREKKQLRRRRS